MPNGVAQPLHAKTQMLCLVCQSRSAPCLLLLLLVLDGGAIALEPDAEGSIPCAPVW